MRSFEIIINENVPLSFEGFLFNEPRLITKKVSSGLYCFHLKKSNQSFARFNLFINGNDGLSHVKSPFGSIEFNSSLKYEELTFFMDKILDFCKEKKLEKVYITSYPQCYSPRNFELLTYILLLNKFYIKTTDLNYHIPVNSFDQNLHLSEKRRLKKCIAQKYEFSTETRSLKEVYQLVKDSRNSKGFPITIEQDALYDLFQNYPNDYILFTLWDNKELIASAIGVKVTSKILYYFLPADHLEYRMFSPSVFLIKKIVEFCKEKHFDILDLGIATSAGIPNEGLIRFKENLGGIPSLKLHFVKDLSI